MPVLLVVSARAAAVVDAMAPPPVLLLLVALLRSLRIVMSTSTLMDDACKRRPLPALEGVSTSEHAGSSHMSVLRSDVASSA